MELKPIEPPGRLNRKLRAHVSEISRLRNEGYTIEAIRKMLAADGVVAGWSSVQREAMRAKSAAETQPVERSNSPKNPLKTTSKPASAEAFFATINDNPLLRRKGKP